MAWNAPQVDRRRASRTVPMKVLVLGFFRTGTSSMQAALEMLGYKETHHGAAVVSNALEADMWMEAIDAKFFGKGQPYGREEWDQLLGHCQAVTDAPSILFSEELIAAYPDAKVILTNRDPEKWWKSYSDTLQVILRSKRVMFAGWLDPRHLGKVLKFTDLTISMMLGSATGAEEEESKTRFVPHYENIRRLVPKERLLEYEVGEGWARLCAFLGKDVPDVNFPRLKDTKALLQSVDDFVGHIFWREAIRLAAPAALLSFLWLAIYTRMYHFW
ncbi:P-loop containing nucleoside triphosphate hydrolase protein [Mycena rebaudengoi]|nr:P-loop containing nucleoside triphosphate hydrolase protein [Mycena rebaudengoi]